MSGAKVHVHLIVALPQDCGATVLQNFTVVPEHGSTRGVQTLELTPRPYSFVEYLGVLPCRLENEVSQPQTRNRPCAFEGEKNRTSASFNSHVLNSTTVRRTRPTQDGFHRAKFHRRAQARYSPCNFLEIGSIHVSQFNT